MARRTGQVIRYQGSRGTVWRLRYTDAGGRRASETLGSEAEGWTERRAREALADRLYQVRHERLQREKPTTLARFARGWLDTYPELRGLRESTRRGYRAILEQHLLEQLGSRRLDEIEPEDLEAYVAAKRRAGFSPATCNRHLNVLSLVYDAAVRRRAVRFNPVRAVERPKEPDRRARWRRLRPEEIGAVAGAFDELIGAAVDEQERAWLEQARVVFLTVHGTGMRRGEILALRWQDVELADPAGPRLHVRRSKTWGGEGPPKSEASRRTILLDAFLAGELFEHRGRSAYRGDGERVFCHPLTGGSLDHKRYADTLAAALVRAGITDRVRPFHDGRHSAITNDAAAGNAPIAVMKRAGHADFRTTQLYIDLAGVEFREEAERAGARTFAHVPPRVQAKVQAKVEGE